jgi:hypothetical protein
MPYGSDLTWAQIKASVAPDKNAATSAQLHPNRTINEFSFQAIGRVSDPDVGTYRLTPLETGLEAIEISQAVALPAGAASAAKPASPRRWPQPDRAISSNLQLAPADRSRPSRRHPHVLAANAVFFVGRPSITISVLRRQPRATSKQ